MSSTLEIKNSRASEIRNGSSRKPDPLIAFTESKVGVKPQPVEEAKLFSKLREHYSSSMIAQLRGVSTVTVQNRLKLLNLPIEIQRKINGKEVRLKDAFK